ncbi:hypothetical protein [Salinicola sp. DM10]|uniref:hypothetical protein n=1 Tax=Salinicola sp. DM10 TaxID=2815721 RepID=UPI001A8FACE7|nr:hypothetical protein [Salinicola sp. DM10]MCE3025739.1 hypothetical protein [Salinicola sp. DM10]
MPDYVSYVLTVWGVGVTAYISHAGRIQTKQHHYVNLRTTIAQELRAEGRKTSSDPNYLKYLLSEYSKEKIAPKHVAFVYQKGCLKKGLGHLEKASNLLSLDPYKAKFFLRRQSLARYERNRNWWFGGYIFIAIMTVIYPAALKHFVDTTGLTLTMKLLQPAGLICILLFSFLVAAVAKKKVDRVRSLKFLLEL